MHGLLICFECKFINEGHDGFQCEKCGACLGDERPHSHDSYDMCVSSHPPKEGENPAFDKFVEMMENFHSDDEEEE